MPTTQTQDTLDEVWKKKNVGWANTCKANELTSKQTSNTNNSTGGTSKPCMLGAQTNCFLTDLFHRDNYKTASWLPRRSILPPPPRLSSTPTSFLHLQLHFLPPRLVSLPPLASLLLPLSPRLPPRLPSPSLPYIVYPNILMSCFSPLLRCPVTVLHHFPWESTSTKTTTS